MRLLSGIFALSAMAGECDSEMAVRARATCVYTKESSH